MRTKRNSMDFTRYALAAATIGAASTAEADFSGAYTLNPPVNGTYSGASAVGPFGDWASTLTYVPTSGTVDFGDSLTPNAPVSVTLQLAVGNTANPTDTFNLATTVEGTGTLSFSWNFTDIGINHGALTFGYVKNGAFTQLANGTSQSSSANVSVAAGDTFGFRLIANYAGSGSVAISNFSAPVPEPAVAALVITGAVGLIALREARRRARAASHDDA